MFLVFSYYKLSYSEHSTLEISFLLGKCLSMSVLYLYVYHIYVYIYIYMAF